VGVYGAVYVSGGAGVNGAEDSGSTGLNTTNLIHVIIIIIITFDAGGGGNVGCCNVVVGGGNDTSM
jgi:hypothetical protein